MGACGAKDASGAAIESLRLRIDPADSDMRTIMKYGARLRNPRILMSFPASRSGASLYCPGQAPGAPSAECLRRFAGRWDRGPCALREQRIHPP
jgi:hypothetical protein